MAPSVLIVSEELSFLIACYAGLHRDERIGQIEATTSQEEAVALIGSLRPDAIVFDSSAGDSFGVSAVGRLSELAPQSTIVVTFRDRDRQAVERTAGASGASGLISRDAFTPEGLLRTIRVQSRPSDSRPSA